MRIQLGFAAAAALIALAVGTSWSAATAPRRPGTTSTTVPVSATNMVPTQDAVSTPLQPSRLNGVRAGVPGVRAVALSQNECKELGGDVFNESACASGKECYTLDEHQNAHEVCISNKE